MASPSPVPPKRCAVVLSAWANSSNSGLLLRRHADPGVGHRELDPLASVCHLARPQLNLALFGELAGVA
jgi:hypothetical protein